MQTVDPLRLLRPAEISQLTGLHRTSIWRLVRRGKFPQPMRLGKRAIAWRAIDVDSWLKRAAKEARAEGRP